MPTSTVEDYLKAIFQRQQAQPGERIATGRLAEDLDLAPGTITAMIKTLAMSGLVDHEPYGGVRLTGAGRELALHVLRRHRLIELFLVQVMGLDWSEVHGEADRLEHVVSDRLVERMDQLLGHPAVDPHGDPIPDANGAVADQEMPTLLTCRLNDAVRVARVVDQDPGFLQLVERQGLKPGAFLTVRARSDAADTVELETAGGELYSLGYRAASKILVSG